MSKQHFKIAHFFHHKTSVINSTNIFHQQITELTSYATKYISVINETSTLTKKTATKNLQSNQDMIFYSPDDRGK